MRKSVTAATLALAILTALLTACSAGQQKPDFAAAEAAKEFYDSLNNGGYKYFTAMTLRTESIPGSYREQLEANSKMYLAGLRKDHGGISEVRIVNCRNDAKGETAEAYILMCFADSTKEEIVVPMVKHEGRWMMR